jgi:nicotinate-nucleotide adenylyltransferase
VSSNFAFYGGTFDPVHRGHIAVAKAALADPRFKLESIYFVPASIPPHKQGQPITSYADRLAMLQLALAQTGEKGFVASQLEAPNPSGVPNYSVNSVRQLKEILRKEYRDPELYFIVGIDSFRELGSWRDPATLMRECKFIVASRPGFSLPKPSDLLPTELKKEFPKGVEDRVFLLPTVAEDVSSTQIRDAVADRKPLGRYVTAGVAAYIAEHRLYR